MMYPYNATLWDPPAPAAEIVIWNPRNSSNIKNIIALIDSGSDITFIPQNIVEELQLIIVDQVLVGGYDTSEGKYKETFLYSAFLRMSPLKPRILPIAPLKQNDYAILGRDILNYWCTTLDGPGRKMEISE